MSKVPRKVKTVELRRVKTVELRNVRRVKDKYDKIKKGISRYRGHI